MRTTLILDDELMKTALEYTGIKEKTALIHLALKELVQKRARERLIALGGSDPAAEAAPRKHYWELYKPNKGNESDEE